MPSAGGSGGLRRTLRRAEVVYSGLGTPRKDGAVVVQEAAGEFRVVAIDALETARRAYPDATEEDAGFALSPPPVNAHTHVDLSHMGFAERDYEAFIAAVIGHSRAGGRGLEAARDGVAEILAGGVCVVGDIVTDESVLRYLLSHPGLRGVAYWEVFGFDPHDAERVLDETRRVIERVRPLERPDGMRLGLSPHTPHTVSPELMQGVVTARVRGAPAASDPRR